MRQNTSLLGKIICFVAALVCADGYALAQNGLSAGNNFGEIQSNYTDLLINATYAAGGAAQGTEATVSAPFTGLFEAKSAFFNGPGITTASTSNGKAVVVSSSGNLLSTFTVSYGFSQMYSKTGNEGLTNSSSISPEFGLVDPDGFSLDAKASYQNDAYHDNKPTTGIGDTYGFSVQTGVDIITLLTKNNSKVAKNIAGDSLNVTLLLGASRGHSGKDAPTGHTGTTIDSLQLQPGLTYIHKYTGTGFALTIQSNYSLAWRDTMNQVPPDYNTDAGVFTLGPRLDYQFANDQNFHLSGGATWDRDIDQDVVPGRIAYYRDWAQFNCGVEYDHSFQTNAGGHVDTSLKLAYTYTAFRPDYDANAILVQGTVRF